jgi:hypothetical protein
VHVGDLPCREVQIHDHGTRITCKTQISRFLSSARIVLYTTIVSDPNDIPEPIEFHERFVYEEPKSTLAGKESGMPPEPQKKEIPIHKEKEPQGPAPFITSIEPRQVPNSGEFPIVIHGEHFRPGLGVYADVNHDGFTWTCSGDGGGDKAYGNRD